MFGPKKSVLAGELDASRLASLLDGSAEFARLWAMPGGPLTCLIDPGKLGPDPFLFGMAMVDSIRHGAKAYAQAVGISEEDALTRILEGFDAERESPTDGPRQIDPRGSVN
jgi:hypothetical protein